MNLRVESPKQQTVVGLGLTVLSLALAYEIGGWIAGENLKQVEYLFVAAAIAVAGVTILRNWRAGFYIFLTWVLFEDAIRKYLGNDMMIYFGKDFLAALIYISLYLAVRDKRDRIFRPPFLIVLSLFFWWVVIQILNPNSPSYLYGFLGLKIDFFYAPLMFVGYALIRSDEDLREFLLVSMLLAAAVAGLGVIQSVVGPGFLNPATLAPDIRELGDLSKETPITHQIIHLPSSVFVSAGRFSGYLFSVSVLGMGTAGYFLLSVARRRWIIFGALGVIAVAIALCGSRGALILSAGSAACMSVAFMWGAPWRTRQVYRMLKAIRRSAIIMAIALALVTLVFPKEIGSRWAFYSETLDPRSTASELTKRVWDYPMYNIMVAFSEPHWVMGYGTGTASLGAQYVARIFKQKKPEVAVESGWGSLVVELGIFGLALWFLWTMVLVVGCWRLVLKLRQTRLFPVGFGAFWFIAVMLIPETYASLNVYQDYVLNAYLWLLVGVLYRLPELLVVRPVAVPAPATSRALVEQLVP
ncbi:MAG: hypothetical protein WB995_14500 [Candidatus Acidiferrales bacterium]